MIFYGEKNVYEAAKDRIRKIFDTYSDRPIVVSFSGGKDSTVILYLTKEIMDERGIKKIPVFWLDQEIEAPMTVDYVRKIMSLSWVEPHWVQSEYPKYNSHSGKMDKVWGKGQYWIREKEPTNPYTDFDLSDYKKYAAEYNFFLHKMFGEYVTLGGLHIDESNVRHTALLRDISFCPSKNDVGGKIFYPLFDWSYKDIWYYIFSNKIEYCKLYNYYFSRWPLRKCRVGSFWNEQSQDGLKLMKEIDPAFYDRVSKRIKGANAVVNAFESLISFVGKLPPYFKDWPEYVNYLIDHIVPLENRKQFRANYNRTRKRFLKQCDNQQELIEKVEEKIGISAAKCVVKEDKTMRELANRCMDIFIMIKEYGNKK